MNRDTMNKFPDSSDDEKTTSSTSMARNARRQRRLESAKNHIEKRNRSRSASVMADGKNEDNFVETSSTSIARDIRRSRHLDSGPSKKNNDAGNNNVPRKEPRQLVLPGGATTPTDNNRNNNSAPSSSSSMPLKRTTGRSRSRMEAEDSDDESIKSSTVRAREVRELRLSRRNQQNSQQDRGRSATRNFSDGSSNAGGQHNERDISHESSMSRNSTQRRRAYEDEKLNENIVGSVFHHGSRQLKATPAGSLHIDINQVSHLQEVHPEQPHLHMEKTGLAQENLDDAQQEKFSLNRESNGRAENPILKTRKGFHHEDEGCTNDFAKVNSTTRTDVSRENVQEHDAVNNYGHMITDFRNTETENVEEKANRDVIEKKFGQGEVITDLDEIGQTPALITPENKNIDAEVEIMKEKERNKEGNYTNGNELSSDLILKDLTTVVPESNPILVQKVDVMKLREMNTEKTEDINDLTSRFAIDMTESSEIRSPTVGDNVLKQLNSLIENEGGDANIKENLITMSAPPSVISTSALVAATPHVSGGHNKDVASVISPLAETPENFCTPQTGITPPTAYHTTQSSLQRQHDVLQNEEANSRWRKYELDEEELLRESREASTKAIVSAVEHAASLDVLKSQPESQDSIMVLNVGNGSNANEVELYEEGAGEREFVNYRGRKKTQGSPMRKERPLSVSAVLQKLATASLDGEEEEINFQEQDDIDEDPLTANGKSLELPTSSHISSHKTSTRKREEKPWAKSLSTRNTQNESNRSSLLRAIDSKDDDDDDMQSTSTKQSDHDRIRQEALQMLNLADSVSASGSMRLSSSERTRRSKSLVSTSVRIDKIKAGGKNLKDGLKAGGMTIREKLMERIRSTQDDNDQEQPVKKSQQLRQGYSHISEDDINVRSSYRIGNFTIGSHDEDEDELVESMRRKPYDDDDEENAISGGGKWSSRFKMGASPTNVFAEDPQSQPTSARGMMRASPYAEVSMADNHMKENSWSNALTAYMVEQDRRSNASSASLTRNSIIAELSKERVKRACYILSFVILISLSILIYDLARGNRNANPVPIIPPSNVIARDVDDPANVNMGNVNMDEFDAITFFVISDVPIDSAEASTLKRYVQTLPTTADFAIHLGDINDASTTLCSASSYYYVESILAQSALPLLVLPGDEDYAACPEPFDSLNQWRESFAHMEDSWGTKTTTKLSEFTVHRQVERPENFAFSLGKVLFLGVNLAGKYARELEPEWQSLHQANVLWTEEKLKGVEPGTTVMIFGHARPGIRQYNRYFQHLQDVIESEGLNDGNVYYMHGDALEDEPNLHIYSPYDVIHDFGLRAIEVERGGVAPPMKVTIDSNGVSIDRRP